MVVCPVLFADTGVSFTEIKGDVQVFKSGDVVGRKVQEGDVIQPQDKIQTGPDGSAIIVVEDTAEIKLGKETTWSLDHFVSEPSKKEFSANLALGRLRAKVKKMPRDSIFEIKTPTSVAAVRGTAFGLFVYEFQEKIYTQLEVFENAVQFSTLTGEQSYLVEEGRSATASGEGTITPPQTSGSETDKVLAVSEKKESGGSDSKKAPLNPPSGPGGTGRINAEGSGNLKSFNPKTGSYSSMAGTPEYSSVAGTSGSSSVVGSAPYSSFEASSPISSIEGSTSLSGSNPDSFAQGTYKAITDSKLGDFDMIQDFGTSSKSGSAPNDLMEPNEPAFSGSSGSTSGTSGSSGSP